MSASQLLICIIFHLLGVHMYSVLTLYLVVIHIKIIRQKILVNVRKKIFAPRPVFIALDTFAV